MNLRNLSRHLALAVVFCLSLMACSTVPERPAPVVMASPPPAPPPPAAAPPPPIPAPAPAPLVMTAPAPIERATMLVRDFIVPERTLNEPYFNLILFSHKPVNKTERDLYISICEHWRASFPEFKEVNVQELPEDFQVISFYWMVRKFTVDNNSCADLVDWYDYGRAKVFLTTKKLKVTKNQIVCRLPSGFVVMDISTLKKPADIELAFKAWQMRMTLVPTKDGVVQIYTLKDSAIAVLGALGSLVTLKL